MPYMHFRPLLALWLAAAASVGHAADPLAQDMKQRLEQASTGVAVRIEGPDQLRVLRDGKPAGVLDLGNLRQVCAKVSGSDCERQKQRLATLSIQALAPAGASLQADSVRPIVRPTAYRSAIDAQLAQVVKSQPGVDRQKATESAPLLMDLGPDFVHGWAEDSEHGMRPISATRMKEARLSAEDLARLGSANLQRETVTPVRPAGDKYPGVLSTRGNDYLPSVLVDEAFWRRVAGPLADKNVTVCLPARHELVIYDPAQDTSGATDFKALCQRLAQNAAPSFSTRVVRRAERRWLLN